MSSSDKANCTKNTWFFFLLLLFFTKVSFFFLSRKYRAYLVNVLTGIYIEEFQVPLLAKIWAYLFWNKGWHEVMTFYFIYHPRSLFTFFKMSLFFSKVQFPRRETVGKVIMNSSIFMKNKTKFTVFEGIQNKILF